MTDSCFRRNDARYELLRGFIFLLISVFTLVPPARAGERAQQASNPPVAVLRPLDPAGDVVFQTLRALHARDGAAALALMDPLRQGDYALNAALYMKNMRLYQHALYNHETFRVLSTEQDGDIAIHKIELRARDGALSLAIFRLRQQPDGTWRVDHIGVIDQTGDRGA